MSTKKIDRKGDEQSQIVNLASEFLTKNYNMKEGQVKGQVSKVVSQLLRNKKGFLEMLAKII